MNKKCIICDKKNKIKFGQLNNICSLTCLAKHLKQKEKKRITHYDWHALCKECMEQVKKSENEPTYCKSNMLGKCDTINCTNKAIYEYYPGLTDLIQKTLTKETNKVFMEEI